MFSTSIYGSWQNIQGKKFKEIKRHLGALQGEIFSGKLILDIGCGFGYFEKFFEGNFIGVDNDIDMLARQKEIFSRALADGGELPFKDGSFDSIICIDTIHLIQGGDFLRVLKKGGFAVMSIFYNDGNYEERKSMLREKLGPLKMIMDFEIHGKEKEYVIVAVKL